VARLKHELAHVPDEQAVREAAEQGGKVLRRYVNAKLRAKMDSSQWVESFTFEDKKALLKAVFKGKTAEGLRMGVRISWLDNGRNWQYRLEGLLPDGEAAVKQSALR
jgi:hypothetical protein